MMYAAYMVWALDLAEELEFEEESKEERKCQICGGQIIVETKWDPALN